jgi:uncharacterized membrane protein yobI
MTSNNSKSINKNGVIEGKNVRDLKSLRPCHDQDQHRMYVDALNNAIKQDEVTNIALSGPYGVGKSSILQGFKKGLDGEDRNDIIFISFSTLGFSNSTDLYSHQSPDGSISPQTNQIQKEIVKQLLYRRRPSSLPASRFKRMQKPDWKHLLVVSALIGIAPTIVIAVIGGFAKIPTVSDSAWWEFGVKFVGVWLLISLASWVASQYLQGAVHLDKFTAGPATLKLSAHNNENGDSYFDRYLDEIIYFFEMSPCRIVVFEDIDRFSNWEIFDELRELNTLLNNAEQIRNKKTDSGTNKIVFIYAMKDSIFEVQVGTDSEEVVKNNQDGATQEIQRANRTKFFDIIIPVVPFVTYRSARDLMRQELEGIEPQVSGELIGRVAKYVPDFRLLRSVCNEYMVYAQSILGDDNLKLDPDKLFALILYKSVHLQDFEKIHLGQSRLDEVYKKSVQVVEGRISALDDEYDALEKQLDPHFTSEMRGAAFKEMIGWLAARTSTSVKSFTVNVGSQAFSSEETTTPQFWMAVHRLETTDSITITDVYNQYGHRMPFELTKLDMAKLMGHDLVFAPLDERPRNVIDSELQRLEIARQKYRSAHMSDLMSDPLAMVPLDDTSQPFAAYVEAVLGSELAAVLVRYGYIDQNFVLYTSIYHDTFLSVNAMTFRLQHMEAGLMNPNYELTDSDVLQLMRDTTIDLKEFARPGAYNISILDYLLANRRTYRNCLDAITLSFLQDSDSTTQFLQSFFSSDSLNKDRLVIELAPRYPGIFTLLVGLRGIPEEKQVNYVDIALQCASPDVNYDTSSLKGVVEASYGSMTIFTSTHDDKSVDTLAELMAQADVKFKNIATIEANLRTPLIEKNCYDVNRNNLEFVSDGHQPSLDVLCREKPVIYSYLLQSLEAYLAIIADDESAKLSSLVGSADTTKVVADVVWLDVVGSTRLEDWATDDTGVADSEAFPLLLSLLESSRSTWSIELDSLPPGCWWALALHDHFAVTTSNLLSYIGQRGVDNALVKLLERHSAIENQEYTINDDEYLKLAAAIINLGSDRLSVGQRVNLVRSIGCDVPIPIHLIKPQKGKLTGCLIRARLIVDTPDAYLLTDKLDWPSRRHVILSSSEFVNYMTPELIGRDVLRIIKSASISDRIKQAIVDELMAYCSRITAADLGQVLNYVRRHGKLHLDASALIWVAAQEIPSDLIFSLLVKDVDELSDWDIIDIISALDSPYRDLVAAERDFIRINTTGNAYALFERLRKMGRISSYKRDGGRRFYVVRTRNSSNR